MINRDFCCKVWRLPTFRLTVYYMLAFCVFSCGLTLYIGNVFNNVLLHDGKKFLTQEHANIEHVYKENGLAGVKDYIEERESQGCGFLYVITTKAGELLTSNVASIDPTLLHLNGYLLSPFTYVTKKPQHYSYAIGCGCQHGDLHILVGQDIESDCNKISYIKEAGFIAIFLITAVGVLIWLFMGRTLLLRIEYLTRASENLSNGDLSARLPITGANDAFDLLSRRLNRMLDRIESLTKNLRYVSDNIAHDLKTPLSRLRMRIEHALMDLCDPQQYKVLLQTILTQTIDLIKVFDSILLISKLEHSNSELLLSSGNLRDVVEEAWECYQAEAEHQDAVLVVENLSDMIIEFHGALVRQALFNVVHNAIKYATIDNPSPKITISMAQDKSYHYIIVEDNGAGIKEIDFPKITERFVRLDESRSKQGFGIGLSLARAILEAHKGVLQFENCNPGLRVKLGFLRKKSSTLME